MAEKNLEKKYEPAGQNDTWEITYTNFGTDKEKAELRAEGERFDNDELLSLLGFKQNSQGEMAISAVDNEVEKDEKGKVTRRSVNGRTLTEVKQRGIER